MKSKLDVAKAMDRFWCIEPEQGEAIASLLASVPADINAASAGSGERKDYGISGSTAVIDIRGSMTKGYSSWSSGTSTVRVRQAVRAAVKDDDVTSILLVIDSPGGQVAGLHDLAEDVRKANAKKPVTAYVEDLCCSAALWVASQAGRIVASPAAQIGSIGCYTVVDDTSVYWAARGVKCNLVSSGDLKGAGAEGVPVSIAYLAEVQAQIDDIADRFCDALASGRKMTKEAAQALCTGKVWTAAEARQLGLVDQLSDLDTLFSQMQRGGYPAKAAAAGTGPKHMATETPDKKGIFAQIGELVVNAVRGNGTIDAEDASASAGLPPETVAATTPQATPAPVLAPVAKLDPAVEERLKSLEEDNARMAEATGAAHAKSIAAEILGANKAFPVERESIASAFLLSLKADGGGTVKIGADGKPVEGANTAALRKAYADRPPHSMTEELVHGESEGMTVKLVPATTQAAKDQIRERYLGATESGKKVLAGATK